MDISGFNQRKNAEIGVFVALENPYGAEKLSDENGECGFMVRGIASRSAQSRLANMERAANEASDEAFLEELHRQMIDQAMAYIISAVNLSIDGKKVETEDDIRAVLECTFPDMQPEKDSEGRPVMIEVTTDDGKKVNAPKLRMVNRPWAKQVIEKAENGSLFFGKTSAA